VTSGAIVRTLRLRAGLTQAELARRAGIGPTVLSAYERNRREPGADVFLELARAAGFDPSWTPRPDDACQGRRLAEVLELAEALPFRPRPMPRARLRAR
jgi:transcriptional regulator with XRE-family HTH domain